MTVRAVAVGIPDRLKEQLTALDGVMVEDDLVIAAGLLELHPGAFLIYGENLFGDAVTGQPVLLLPEQRDGARPIPRVMVVMDLNPTAMLDDLRWDDPRRLAMQAGIRLRAGRVVDASAVGVWVALDVLLDGPVDTPNTGGYTQVTGNDENGDPDA